MPIDALKFARLFVTSSLAADSNVLRCIIVFAHDLGLDTVGKGVETVEQLDQLRSMGCRYAQGFLIAHPLSAGDVRAFLDERAVIGNPAASLLSPIG